MPGWLAFLLANYPPFFDIYSRTCLSKKTATVIRDNYREGGRSRRRQVSIISLSMIFRLEKGNRVEKDWPTRLALEGMTKVERFGLRIRIYQWEPRRIGGALQQSKIYARWLGYRSVGSGRCSPRSVSLPFALFFCLYLLSPPSLFTPSRNISLARPFHLPRYLSLPPPFARSPPSNEPLLLRPFYYSYYFHTPPPPHHHTTSAVTPATFLCWGHGTTVPHCCARPQKDANFNSILSNIIYVCTR